MARFTAVNPAVHPATGDDGPISGCHRFVQQSQLPEAIVQWVAGLVREFAGQRRPIDSRPPVSRRAMLGS